MKKYLNLLLLILAPLLGYSQEPTVDETIDYIETQIDRHFLSKNLLLYSCRSYKCKTSSFNLEVDKYGIITITERVYDDLFDKINNNVFQFNLKDVKIKIMSNIAIIFEPVASKNAIKMLSGNACCENNLTSWNHWHSQLSILTTDSYFPYDDQWKIYNGFKYLQENVFSDAIEEPNDNDFFASKNYSNRNKLIGPNSSSTRVYSKNGVKTIKLSIDNLEYDGILDSGAATFLITEMMVKKMLSSGYITKNNFTGANKYSVANGETVIGLELTIPTVKIADYTLKNVQATVIKGVDSDILIGQTILNRFSKWEVDYDRHILILKK